MANQILRRAGLFLGIAAGLKLASGITKLRRFSFNGRTVVITGGSRGLGLVLARQFAREGARVAILARREEELKRAETSLARGGSQVLAVPCDLREREQVNAAMDLIAHEFGRIDVLVNNAGVIQVGPLDHMTVEDFEDALAIHLFAPLFTTLAVLPRMRRVGGGRIVNIASIGGKVAFPHLLPYTASKFALVGLSDGLRAELRRENIYVTTVCPGLTRTGSPPNARFKGNHHREFTWFSISDSLPLISMDAEKAARKIISACRRGAARVVLGVPAKAGVLLNELFPEVTANLLSFAERLLPEAVPDTASKGANRTYSGWESETALSRSFLTRLSRTAGLQNNQRPC